MDNNMNNNAPKGEEETNTHNQQQNTIDIDYEKLASIVEGRANAAGETALKKYFQQQGLTGEEMKTAINQFKDQKEENTSDVVNMQNQIADAQKQVSIAQVQVQKAQIESLATITAVTLGEFERCRVTSKE